MRIAFAVLMALHGVAHLVGFAVSWRLLESDEVPFKTTLLLGRLDVGVSGIKVVGLVWLLLAVVFVGAAAGALARQSWWTGVATAVAVASLVVSVVSLPEARIGVVINLVILGMLAAAPRAGWW